MKSRILLVDDTEVFREPIAAGLEKNGYTVLLSANGQEAIRKLEKESSPVDLILLDMSMPLMDGPTFLKHIRGFAEWADIPVIMLTATAHSVNETEDNPLGVKDYLLKSSFSLSELIATINKHLV